MNKEDLKELAADKKFISGIYNYCDRWCERCSFTSRCLNYAMGEEDRDDPATYDVNNEAFWKKLHDSFQLTLELLTEMAEERGIDLNQVDTESSAQTTDQIREKADAHELSQAAEKYSKAAEKWFDENEALFEQREKELNTELEIGLDITNLDREAAGIIDAVEVIRWYQHQIYVKLMRALMQDEHDIFDEENGFPKDSDGSAKVALIGMDRSIGAWGKLINHFPDKTDDILEILIHLDRLRKNTERTFSDARAFVRPGFDTLSDVV